MKEKLRKSRRILLIITLILAIITIAFFSVYIIARNKNGEVLLVDMELVGSDEIAAKVDVSFISGRIAKDKEGKNYYFVGDDEHIFLYATKNELNDELKSIMDYSYSVTDKKPVAYRVMGITEEIPNDLKNIALEAYNKLFENEQIEEFQFESYIGEYYLEDYELFDSLENIKLIMLIISASLMIISVILLILSI